MGRIIIALYVLTTSSALTLLKLGAQHGAPIRFSDNKLLFNLNAVILGGFFLYGTSFLIYTYLVAKYDLGYIIPLTTAFVYVLIFTASFFIFNEHFTLTKVIGIVLILAGVIFLNLKG